MGLSDMVKFNPWTVVAVDSGVSLELEGEFQPEDGVEVNGAPVLGQTSTVGSAEPATQWVSGGARTVRIRSSFFSRHTLEDIRDRYDALEALDRHDPTLGRAPRVSFTWGTIEIEGFATVRKRITAFWPVTDFPRQIVFDLTITRAVPLDLGDSGSGSGETQHVTLAEGETFEILALRHFGDPLRGELIRRENPGLAHGEEAGDRAKILERTHPRMRGTVRPTSPPFLSVGRGGPDELLAALAVDRGSGTRGISWERLPEVLAGEV